MNDQVGLHDMIERLRLLAAERDLVGHAMDGCVKWLHNDADEIAITPEELEMHFHSHALTFHNANLSYPYIDTRLTLSVKNREIGYYRLITFLDGSVDDDYFVLDSFESSHAVS
jgi:hypothetical protein